MATRTNPLVSAAVLASAAAIAVATPAIAPSVQLPSPHALQAAKVQLATFSDLLSVSATDWSNVFFGGYGEAISPNQDPDFDWAAAYVSPFTRCNFNCTVSGPSGIGYLALDALIDGNGSGYAPVLKDPTKPYNDTTNPYVGGYPTWSVSAVNYYFEGGPGPGTAYLVASPFGNPKSPLYNPTVAGLIMQVFQGLPVLTNYYVAGLDAIAKLAKQVPTVGPYIYGAINAYLGPQTADPQFGDWGYAAGLSGILRYVSDVVTTGGNPYPPYGPTPPAASGSAASVATLAAAAVPAAASAVAAPKVETVAESAPAARAAKDTAPAVSEVEVSAPADSAPADSSPAVSAPVVSKPESAPEVGEAKASAPAAVDTPPVSTPEVKAAEEPSVPEVKPSTPAADSAPEAGELSSRELKNLEKETAKAESSSADTASESKSGVSDSKAGGSDAKAGASEAPAGASEAVASDAKAGGSDAGSGTDAGDSAK